MKTAFCALLVGILVACSQPLSQADASQKALTVLGELSSGRWGAVVAQFDTKMKTGLSAEQLQVGWDALKREHGAYRSHGTPQVTTHGDLATVDVDTLFGATHIDYRMTFDPNGQIGGLYLLNT
jgi:uncharacterized protein DUF3887